MADPIFARQRQIVGTADDWSTNDLVLGAGELALVREDDGTVRARVGDGGTPFSASPFLSTSVAVFRYKGNTDPTGDPPAGAIPGDIYSASPGGVVDDAWGPPAAGMTVDEGDFLIMTADGSWTVQSGGVDLSGFVATADLAAPGGSAMVGFIQAGTGAVARTVQAKLRDVVSVRDFGAVGDGVANDAPAIQAAFDSGAKKVVFPKGVYKCGAPLTVPAWLHLVGEAYQPGVDPATADVRIEFALAAGVALACGHNPTIENIFFRNIGGTYNEGTAILTGTTAIAIDIPGNAMLIRCGFATWATCLRLGAASYYVKTRDVEFNRCTVGYQVGSAAPYDVHIDSPISRQTTIFFQGVAAQPARNIKIFGGSIEGYSVVANNFLDLAVFGTYFETISQRDGAVAIDPLVNGSSVALFGCEIYMNYTSRFVSMSTLSNAMLTGSGNIFDGIGRAAGVCYYLPASGTVALHGDRFGQGHPATCVYVDSIVSAFRFNVSMPVLPAGNNQIGYSGLTIFSPRGFIMGNLGAEPATANKVVGVTVLANGDTWDPLARASGRPYWVVWQGDRWRSPGGGV